MNRDITIHQQLENPLTKGQLALLQRAGRDENGINEIAELVRQEPDVNADSIVAFASTGVAPAIIGSAISVWHDAGLDGENPVISPESLIFLAEFMGVNPAQIDLPKGQVMLGGRNVSLRQAMDEEFGQLAEAFGLTLENDALSLPGGSGVPVPTSKATLDTASQAGTESPRSFEGGPFTTASEEMFLVVVAFIRDLVPEDYVADERDPANVFIQVALTRYGDIRDAYRVIAADEEEAETLSNLFKQALMGGGSNASFLRPKASEDDYDHTDLVNDDEVSLDKLRTEEFEED